MKRFVATATILILSLAAFAVEKQYQNGVILKNDQKKNTRVVYWAVDTPITKDDLYYDVTIELATKVYVARYTPRHEDDPLPDQWTAGSTQKVRIDGGHLYLEDSDGAETKLVIIKRRAPTPAEQMSAPPQPAK
ncbi:MAG TPA: hypothetical protein VF753_10205 [Terriglobales bacterium]